MNKDTLISGVETMLKIAVQILSKKRRVASQPYLLPDATKEDDASQRPRELKDAWKPMAFRRSFVWEYDPVTCCFWMYLTVGVQAPRSFCIVLLCWLF